MREHFLPFSPPSIGEEEITEVTEALRSGWISAGPRTRQFESEFSHRVDAPASLALNSCTAGLHLALLAHGIGPGDEVITTPLTFAATVNMIEMVGARPILVDVEPETLNIDPLKIEQALSSRTRAIMPVHFAGHPAELDAINEIARKHRLVVIEDAAHALPAKYRGRMIGSGPNPAAFSFYATKNLTTGEGGMLTGPEDLLAEARITGLHGMSREAWKRYEKGGSWAYDVSRPGLKYNMCDIQAAIGLCQLRRLSQFQQRRREIVRAYTGAFGDEPAFQLPVSRPHVEHAWHLFVLRLRDGHLSIDRNRFVEELASRNIGTSVHFIPIHYHSFYRDRYRFSKGDFAVAEDSYRRMLSLPLNPSMTDADVGDVIDAVLDSAAAFRLKRIAA